MRQSSFDDIDLAPELKQAMIDYHGFPPDNFVESAQATIERLPDLDADPAARSTLDRLWEGMEEITRERRGRNGNNGHDHTPEPPTAAGEPEQG